MENYHEINRESFSSISKLAEGPQSYLKYKNRDTFEDKSYFRLGKLVDDLRCLKDYSTLHEYITDRYAINIFSEPTAQSYTLAQALINSEEECTEDLALKLIEDLKLFGNTKKKELLVVKYKEVEDYLLFFKHNKKEILQFEEQQKVTNIINSFLSNEYTKKYMENNSTEDIEYINELPILWNISFKGTDNKVDLKSKLDKVIINHKDKTIEPLDFKTTGDKTSKFKKSYIQFRYYYQAAMYLGALNYLQVKENWYSDYTILPFKFIVETTELESIGNPLVFEIPFEEATIATYNKSQYRVGYTPIKGWIQLIEDLIWYQENGFEKDKEYVDGGGKYELKIFE